MVSALHKVLLLVGALLLMSVMGCRRAAAPAVPPVDSTMTRAQKLTTLIADDSSLTVFARLLDATGLEATLRRVGPHTVFAPTDAAFRHATLALDSLRGPAQRDSLRTLVAYHLARGHIRLGGAGALRISTLAAQPLTLRRVDDSREVPIRIQGVAIRRIVPARDGLLYVLVGVLHPPAMPSGGTSP